MIGRFYDVLVTFCSVTWTISEPKAGLSATMVSVKPPFIEVPLRVVLQFDKVSVALRICA